MIQENKSKSKAGGSGQPSNPLANPQTDVQSNRLSENTGTKTKPTIEVTKMVRLAALAAIIILMAFTPLGYLKYGPLSITFLQIPVVVGAIILGPVAGAILGGVFGATSFAQCFGLDAFGTMLFGLNPIGTFILCMVPRILMGFLAGHIFKALYRIDKTRLASYAVSTLSGALLNTLLFMGLFVLFFYNTVVSWAADAGKVLFPYLVAFVGVNGVVEAVVCLIVGAAIAKVLDIVLKRNTVR